MEIKKNKNDEEHITNDKYYLLVEKLSDRVVIKGEKKQEFVDSAIKTLQELVPKTEIEINLCEKYIILHWQLRRVLILERILLSEQNSRLNSTEEWKIQIGRMKNRRVRNIERIDLSDPGVINLIQQQQDLEKRIAKTLDRIREEQRINTEN